MDSTDRHEGEQGPAFGIAEGDLFWHAARAYAADLGWHVFPLFGVQDGLCVCRSGRRCRDAGKHPRIKNNLKRATTNLKQIWDWSVAWPDANVAVATGPDSGVIVVDVDPRNGGDRTAQALLRELGPLPRSPTVDTAGGGFHHYFRSAEGVRLKPKAGPGVDIKGAGGYAILPPSRTGQGTYCWALHPAHCPPPPLPASWLGRITRPSALLIAQSPKMDTLTWGYGGSSGAASAPSAPLAEYVEEALRRSLPHAQGTRNDHLKRFVRLLKRHPELADVPVESIRPYVEEWHGRAIPKIRDRCFLKSTWKETKSLWESFDPRLQAMDIVAATAFQEELPAFVHERKYKPALVKLVLLCRALQRVWGEQAFPLDCRAARDLIGVGSPQTAKNYFERLERDGVIRCTSKGAYRTGQASEWKYLPRLDE